MNVLIVYALLLRNINIHTIYYGIQQMSVFLNVDNKQIAVVI